MCEVFFIEAGTGQMAIDGIAHPLAPGTCIAVSPRETHEIANTGPEELVITYFGLQV
jgi:mannose-6-phosphate isomerase-like protein (cupin superfamily)